MTLEVGRGCLDEHGPRPSSVELRGELRSSKARAVSMWASQVRTTGGGHGRIEP